MDMFDKYKNIYCVNCGERGHVVKNCVGPITSFGIIAFKIVNIHTEELNDKNEYLKSITKETITDNIYPKIKFLMIQRKDTMGYIDLLRGKYPETKKYNYIKTYIEEMTQEERTNILTKNFDLLWSDLWVNHSSKTFLNEYSQSYYKYSKLDIKSLLEKTKSKYIYSEFSLPKGRRNMKESNLECAKREFEEETGYKRSNYTLLQKPPVIEEFTGTNGIKYKHVYYIAKMKGRKPLPKIDNNNMSQIGEVKNIGWFGINECIHLIRPYDDEKKKILTSVHEYLKPYKFNK